MNKINKGLTVTVIVLLLLIGGVLTQSLIRQNQANRVAFKIKESVAQANNKKLGFKSAIDKYKKDIEFIQSHQPLVRIGFQQSYAQGISCGELFDLLDYAEVLNHEGGFAYIPVILALLDAFQCAL